MADLLSSSYSPSWKSPRPPSLRVFLSILFLILAPCCLSADSPRGTTGRFTIRASDYLSKSDSRFKNPPPIPNDGHPFPLAVKNESSKCHRVLGRAGCAPEFVIAGSMKCGTTSLYGYLLEHPKVLPLNQNVHKNQKSKVIKAPLASKEIRFFNSQQYNSAVGSLGLEEAIRSYLDLFQEIEYNPDQKEQMITGEATPMYVCQIEVAQNTYRALPHAKIIIMMRNPVDRVYSEYWFKKSLTPQSKPVNRPSDSDETLFSVCIDVDSKAAEICHFGSWDPLAAFSQGQKTPNVEPEELYRCSTATSQSFKRQDPVGEECTKGIWAGLCGRDRGCTSATVRNSIYAVQLVPWLRYFPLTNILIVRSEDFYSHTDTVMQEIQEFLELPEFEWEKVTDKAFNIMNPKVNKEAVFKQKTAGLAMGQTSVETVSDYPEMSPQIRKTLSRFFQPYNEKLSKLLNLPFQLWEEDFAMGQ